MAHKTAIATVAMVMLVATVNAQQNAVADTLRTSVATVVATPTPPSPDSTAINRTAQSNAHIERMMMRADRRREKCELFTSHLDSLVRSGEYVFWPNSMQELPQGTIEMIYNEAFYMALFEKHLEVHLPVVRGYVLQYIDIINFDTFEVNDYQTARTQSGWSITFNFTSSQNITYTANLLVCSLTGETILNLLTTHNTMHYVGQIEPVDSH